MTATELAQKVIDRLQAANYAEATIKRYKIILMQIVCFTEENGENEYTPELGLLYLDEKKKTLTSKSFDDYQAVIKQINDVLNGSEFQPVHNKKATYCPPSVYAEAYRAFIDFRELKQLSENTLDKEKRYVCYFLNELVSKGCLSFTNLTPQLIIEVTGESKFTFHKSTIRHFLNFLYEAQYVSFNYSIFIVLSRRQYRLPPFYTKEEQRIMHSEMIKNDKTSKRNNAIFLLATRYGFRDGNIAGLKFENVNFDENKITITQVKTGVTKSYPLYSDVKDALLDYIHNERPDCEIDFIFVTSTAPYRRLQAIYAIFFNAIKASGINTRDRKMGSHSAGRASLATEMINNGMSYELVREALGHTSNNVITKYAALDIEKLRVCAQPVKQPSGFFEQFLEGKIKL